MEIKMTKEEAEILNTHFSDSERKLISWIELSDYGSTVTVYYKNGLDITHATELLTNR
jgi:hypothetical protein